MNVLIVAKTRMRGGACVGAISETGRSLRLIPADIDRDGGFNLEYRVGDVWELQDYTFPDDLIAPHTEDVIVSRKRHLRRWPDPEPRVEKLMPPAVGGVELLFDGLTRTATSGSLYISEGTGVPTYSTMFWRPDKSLCLDDNRKRLHYCYPSENGGLALAFVGFQDPLREIPAGTLLRVSLAHWWRPDEADEMELRCYCQLSGWYLPESAPPEPPGPPDPQKPGSYSDIHRILQSVFGFEEFREPQEDIVRGLLDGRDALVIMPTGGGKSLCYQLAAVAMGGVTVVVSPLIALMQDQVDALTTRDIPATFLNSTLDNATYVERQQLIKRNQVRLLYVAPETLARPETIHMLQQSRLSLLAIDEAHCISEWGPDFRPEYRQLGEIRRRLRAVPCVALTATAAPRVQQDIVRCLGIADDRVYAGNLDRSNLFLEVRQRSSSPIEQVVAFIQAHESQSGIVYCATRAGVDEMCAGLNRRGISALAYHAGLDDNVRLKNQNRFVRDDANVMVATIAFGMGIDKSNIRFVVHANMPDSLDKYYQQIGRSGRDGLRADCLLLYGATDLRTIRYHISNMAPEERPGAYRRLDEIGRWVESQSCRRMRLLRYFGQEHVVEKCGMCDRCVAEDADQADLEDLTEYARLFLSCVLQTREGFGKTHIVDILRGSRSQKLLRWKHDRITAYGRGSGLSKDGWRDVAGQLLDRGLVTTGEMNVLRVTERGREVLEGGTFRGSAPSTGHAPVFAQRAADRQEMRYDAALFDKLRALRKSLADEANLPPYTVFHDSSLQEMAAFYPSTVAEFRDIRGVGDVKAGKYGAPFLAVIGEHCAQVGDQRTQIKYALPSEAEVDAPELRPRTRQVVACFLETKSLARASEQLGIAPSTVAGHLERYVMAGYRLPLELVMDESSVPDEQRAEIFRMFAASDSDALKPIFDYFGGEVPYSELRILLLWYRLAQ